MEEAHLILASSSPRRKDLLEQVWVAADVCPADIEEVKSPDEDPFSYTSRLSKEKAEAISHKYPASYILGADTIVVTRDGEVLEKPVDDKDAFQMLSKISGTVHIVATAYSLVCKEKNISVSKLVKTEVEMVNLSESEIENYIDTEEPKGKAGAYAIQGAAGGFINSIMGSYTNVVGLPVAEVLETLIEHQVISSRL